MKNASTGKITSDKAAGLKDRTDWARVRAMRDADILHDAECPATTVADWAGAALKQGGVVVGNARTRGPGKRPKKEQVAIRFSADVLAAFRATGRGWQTRMDAALREWLHFVPKSPDI
jgi:uncharacterized protein (DUF4415 family)